MVFLQSQGFDVFLQGFEGRSLWILLVHCVSRSTCCFSSSSHQIKKLKDIHILLLAQNRSVSTAHVMPNHDQPIATTMTRDEPTVSQKKWTSNFDAIAPLQVEIDRKVTKRKVTVGCAESNYETDADDWLGCSEEYCCGHPCCAMLCVSCWLPWWGCSRDGMCLCNNEPYYGPFCKFEKEVGGRPKVVGCVIDPVDRWRWLPASGLIFGALWCVVVTSVAASSLCCPNYCDVDCYDKVGTEKINLEMLTGNRIDFELDS